MQREEKQNIIIKCVENVNILGDLDRKLAAVAPFAKSKGLKIDQLMGKIVPSVIDNWYKGIAKEMSQNSEYRYLDGSYYGQLAALSADEIISQLGSDDMWDEDAVNELRVYIRFYISNLTKSLDVFTGIFNNYQTKMLINEIRDTVEVDSEKNAKLDSLLHKTTLTHEISTILQEVLPDISKLNKALALCSKYIIRSNLMVDDIVLRIQYEDTVCDQAKSALEPFIHSLSCYDASSIMVNDFNEQCSKAEALVETLNTKETDISLIQDYEILYLEATKSEDPYVRDMSVTSIPASIIDKVILAGKAIPELLEFIYTPRDQTSASTEEF